MIIADPFQPEIFCSILCYGQSYAKGINRCQKSNKTCVSLETYKILGFREDFNIFRNYSLAQNKRYIPSFSTRKTALESRSSIKKTNKQKPPQKITTYFQS